MVQRPPLFEHGCVLDLASERAGESQEGGTCLGCAGNFITFILAEMNLHINLGLTQLKIFGAETEKM